MLGGPRRAQGLLWGNEEQPSWESGRGEARLGRTVQAGTQFTVMLSRVEVE